MQNTTRLQDIDELTKAQKRFIKKIQKDLTGDGEAYGLKVKKGEHGDSIFVYVDRVALRPDEIQGDVSAVHHNYLTVKQYSDTFYVHLDGNAGQREFDDNLDRDLDYRLKHESEVKELRENGEDEQ